jgi:surface antigen
VFRRSSDRPQRLRRIPAIALLALIASLLVPVLTAPPAAADTTLCSGSSYSTCTSAGYTDHGYGAHNGTSYWGMFTGHNCTNYVAYVQATRNGATTSTSGDASQWDNNAPAGTVNSSPGLGAVAQWEIDANRPAGHVAYVESYTANSITVSEDNWSSGPFSWKTITSGSADWPDHFIHFKDLASDTTIGAYVPGSATYYLRNTNSSGAADVTLSFGNSNWVPITGDWNGDGTTTIGAYNPSTANFYLRNTNSTGSADLTFQFGNANQGWSMPMARSCGPISSWGPMSILVPWRKYGLDAG